MTPIRILQIVPAMNCGGMENFIMNLYRNMDRSLVQFDFLYHYAAPSFFDAEIEAMGGRIYRCSVREDNNFLAYLRQLDTFFAQHPEYRVIHGHYSGFGMFYNHYAKKHGVRVRIGHSHLAGVEKNLTGFFDYCLSRPFGASLTDRFACSEIAGRFLFGKRDFTMIPNGIDTKHFTAEKECGAAFRLERKIPSDAILYGHVGRFDQQKNHIFLLHVFAEIAKQQKNAVLLLVGEGPLQAQCRAWCEEHALADKVLFAGLCRDMRPAYSAMDVFLFPSNFEGLPLALIEAQSTGLPCLVSDRVSSQSAITELVHFMPLEAGEAAWAQEAQKLAAPSDRKPYAKRVAASGFDSAQKAAELQKFYLEKYNAI